MCLFSSMLIRWKYFRCSVPFVLCLRALHLHFHPYLSSWWCRGCGWWGHSPRSLVLGALVGAEFVGSLVAEVYLIFDSGKLLNHVWWTSNLNSFIKDNSNFRQVLWNAQTALAVLWCLCFYNYFVLLAILLLLTCWFCLMKVCVRLLASENQSR